MDFNFHNNPHPPQMPPVSTAGGAMDLDEVREAMAVYDKQIDGMVAQAEALKIIDDDSNATAVSMAAQAKRLNNAIEDARTGFVKPHNEFVKQVNGLAKVYQGRFGAIEAGLKRKISVYSQEKELERRKQEEAARKAQAEIQAKIDAEAKAAGVEPVKIEAPAVPVQSRVVRTEAGSASQRKVWKFEVTDPAAVPRSYLLVDEKSIREAVKMGVREISGVRIYEETETVIRA